MRATERVSNWRGYGDKPASETHDLHGRWMCTRSDTRSRLKQAPWLRRNGPSGSASNARCKSIAAPSLRGRALRAARPTSWNDAPDPLNFNPHKKACAHVLTETGRQRARGVASPRTAPRPAHSTRGSGPDARACACLRQLVKHVETRRRRAATSDPLGSRKSVAVGESPKR